MYALVIFITLPVLIFSSNLTFLDRKESGVQLVLSMLLISSDSSCKGDSLSFRDSSEKTRASNLVSSNNRLTLI